MNAQEKQQGLNEVVVRKVEKMVTARQENVRAVIGRLHREQELLRRERTSCTDTRSDNWPPAWTFRRVTCARWLPGSRGSVRWRPTC